MLERKLSLPKKNYHGDNVRLTPSDIARYCQVSRSTALQWIKDNKLKAYRLPGGHYRINKWDFRDFLEENNMPIEEWLLESKSEKKGGKQ